MSNKRDNIEELFRDQLKDHEVDVDPGLWNEIQSEVQNADASGSSNSGAEGSTSASSSTGTAAVSGKLITGLAAAVTVAGISAGVYLSRSEPDTAERTSEITQSTQQQEEESSDSPQEQPKETSTTTQSAGSASPEKDDRNETESNDLEVADATSASGENGEEVIRDESDAGSASGSDRDEQTEASTQAAGASTPEGNEEQSSTASGEAAEADEQPETTEGKSSTIKFEKKIQVNPVSGTAPLTVEMSSYESLKRAKWEFDDGSEPDENTTTLHEFKDPGTYMVSLTGETESGEIFIDMQTVTVKEPAEEQPEKPDAPPALIDVSNVITPNGDGVNDQLNFIAENVVEFKMQVFDRGGKLVFETTTPDKKWDGRDRAGRICNEGVYFYRIIAEGNDGNVYQPQGSVQLKR